MNGGAPSQRPAPDGTLAVPTCKYHDARPHARAAPTLCIHQTLFYTTTVLCAWGALSALQVGSECQVYTPCPAFFPFRRRPHTDCTSNSTWPHALLVSAHAASPMSHLPSHVRQTWHIVDSTRLPARKIKTTTSTKARFLGR